MLSGAGVRSVSVAGSGIFTGSAAEARIKANALAGLIDDYELSFESGERMRGRFLLTRLDYAGDYNGERTYALSLESSGAVVACEPLVSKRCFKPVGPANPARGEAAIVVAGGTLLLRPSFAALVAAEGELGPLFGLVERAASGDSRSANWRACSSIASPSGPEGLTRERIGEALAEQGLAKATPALKVLLTQILQGRV